MAGGIDHRGRAAVVDLEGVLGGGGKVAAELGEKPWRRPGVPVDDLVVVADAEHVEARGRQQPDEQHVRRCEVLELVDQEMSVARLLGPAERPVAQEQLDGQQHLLVEIDDAPAA